MPAFASFEPSNFCNLRCPECPVGMHKNFNRKAETMSFDLFQNIFNEVKSTLLHAIFYFQGEPLLNKNLAQMVRFAHQNCVFTSTSTNAQFLDDEVARLLVEAKLDKLIISIDGSTQASYEQYRVGGSLTNAIEGVNSIAKWKKQLNSQTPFVEIQCLLLKSNETQRAEMQQLAYSLNADRLIFKTAQFYDFENGNPLMPSDEKNSRYKKSKNGKYLIKNKLRNRCHRLWAGVVFAADGQILPCCYDKNADFSFGFFEKDNFKAIWNGQKANILRKKVLENRRQFEMCRNCTE
ncbi:MAG: radical SAM protein [Prevotellaceae bacterium]|jgi:radical SAM protein with 4Fe4S-binding SPASM domain|nr:radical SAM protein [Prevotellaceae bacterium]